MHHAPGLQHFPACYPPFLLLLLLLPYIHPSFPPHHPPLRIERNSWWSRGFLHFSVPRKLVRTPTSFPPSKEQGWLCQRGKKWVVARSKKMPPPVRHIPSESLTLVAAVSIVQTFPPTDITQKAPPELNNVFMFVEVSLINQTTLRKSRKDFIISLYRLEGV